VCLSVCMCTSPQLGTGDLVSGGEVAYPTGKFGK